MLWIPAEFRIPARKLHSVSVWKIGGIGHFPSEFIKALNRNGTSWLSVARTRSGGIGINILVWWLLCASGMSKCMKEIEWQLYIGKQRLKWYYWIYRFTKCAFSPLGKVLKIPVRLWHDTVYMKELEREISVVLIQYVGNQCKQAQPHARVLGRKTSSVGSKQIIARELGPASRIWVHNYNPK